MAFIIMNIHFDFQLVNINSQKLEKNLKMIIGPMMTDTVYEQIHNC